MILILYGTDFFGKNTVRGYGNHHLPTTTGKHKRKLRLFCPLPQSTISGILGYFQGCIAEYRDPQKTLAMGDGREVTRTKPIGAI
ncbi:UNVERIFIED_CONTAM: hypothetical protein GTU68_019652 [Idotea baltica]|nr:hypothetical protein [Idotea baltica]